jgi:hypothetical protein
MIKLKKKEKSNLKTLINLLNPCLLTYLILKLKFFFETTHLILHYKSIFEKI